MPYPVKLFKIKRGKGLKKQENLYRNPYHIEYEKITIDIIQPNNKIGNIQGV